MTREEIAARNRLNAQKSTGPKTASGKAVVAGNARRHGVTARPDPDTIATWVRIILDDPDITAEALLPTNERGVRALLLAQAEVQLVTAHRALLDFEGGRPKTLQLGHQLSEKRARLLKRYLGEAKAQRSKALSAWLIVSGGGRMAA